MSCLPIVATESEQVPKGTRTEVDPEVPRRRLRTALQQTRVDADKTQLEVATALEWSLSKVVRMESGAVRIAPTDLRALLDYYGIQDPGRVGRLLADARAARAPAWWADHQGLLSREFISYLGFEGSATHLRQFHASLIPGLLQTEPYARAVLTAVREQENVEELVRARLRRQRLLDRSDEPQFDFVLDEAALRRRIGGREVMLEQLRQLEDLSRRPNISIRTVPFDAGAYAGLAGSFVALEIEDEQVVYVEDAEGGLLRRDDLPATEGYLSRFRQLIEVAEPIETILGTVMAQLGAQARPEDAVR